MPPYVLEPRETFTPDPDCPHCARNPGYPHRHWRQKDPAPAWEPNWAWRLAFKIMGDGNTG